MSTAQSSLSDRSMIVVIDPVDKGADIALRKHNCPSKVAFDQASEYFLAGRCAEADDAIARAVAHIGSVDPRFGNC